MRTITPERQLVKRKAQRLAQRGLSEAEVVRRLGVARRTIRDWLKGGNEGGNGVLITAHITARKMDVHFSSTAAEWTTPQNITGLVIKVLGTIDLDPCADESRTVPAEHHFTQADDGLDQDWHGRVYMNPPYGREIEPWVKHLCREYRMGRLTEAIALLPARTDTKWMQHLDSYPKCFIRGRLKFGHSQTGAPFPSVAVYLGANPDGFAQVFQALGTIQAVSGGITG